MRVDQYLPAVGLLKQRSAAKRACLRGEVLLDGRPAKAGDRVAVNQRLQVRLRWRLVEAVVLEVPSGPVARKDRGKFLAIVADRPIGEEEIGSQTYKE